MAVETRKLDFRFTTIPLTLVSYGEIYKSLYSSSMRTFKVPTQNFRTKTVGSKQPCGIRDCYQYPKEVIDSQTNQETHVCVSPVRRHLYQHEDPLKERTLGRTSKVFLLDGLCHHPGETQTRGTQPRTKDITSPDIYAAHVSYTSSTEHHLLMMRRQFSPLMHSGAYACITNTHGGFQTSFKGFPCIFSMQQTFSNTYSCPSNTLVAYVH